MTNEKTTFLKKKTIFIFLLIAFLLIFVWYQNNHIVIDVYHYQSNKISSDTNPFHIVQISDLHNTCFGKGNSKLINKIEDCQPDIVVITGDIIDSNHTNLPVAIEFVSEIAKNYPVFYVTGNHEHWLDAEQKKTLFAGIRNTGAIILNNEKHFIEIGNDSMTLIGLDDNSLDDITLHSIQKNCDKNNLTVMLAHEPQYFDRYCDAEVDLVLTGHAHGGQMILPFLGPLIAPDQGFFPKYTAGEHQTGNTTMYISRGLGNSVIPVRLFNYPEIVCIEIS